MKLIHKHLSILTTAIFIGIGALTACGASEKSTNDTPPVSVGQHQPATENKISAGNKSSENKSVEKFQTKSIEVFDGRNGDVKYGSLTEVDRYLVEADVRKKAKEDFLKNQTFGDFNWKEEFKILDVADGSFTAPNLEGQRAVLYRYSYTNGVVILSDGSIVAHYSGGPGDFAFYTAIKSLPDVNQNGLSEIVLFRNVEDNEDIISYLFEAKGDKIKFLGEAGFFAAGYLAGDDVDVEKVKQNAYVVTVQPSKNPVWLQDVYERTGSKGAWKLTKKAEKFSWDISPLDDDVYDLTKIG